MPLEVKGLRMFFVPFAQIPYNSDVIIIKSLRKERMGREKSDIILRSIFSSPGVLPRLGKAMW